MSGRATLNPWDRGSPINLQPYPNLLFRQSYVAIHDFLRNEAEVRQQLDALDQATAGMGQQGFQAHLAALEAGFGFNSQLGVITTDDDLIKSSRFWLYLMNRQPLVDYGAGETDHGVLIHRVQWALIGQWNARTGRATGAPGAIAEIYQNLGAANARAITPQMQQRMDQGAKLDTGAKGVRVFYSVWDELVDASMPLSNATVPEYFRRYIEYRYPGLYARVRM